VLVMSGARTVVSPDDNLAADMVSGPHHARAAFDYLVRRPDVEPTLVGFVGVCLGGGTCLPAACQAELATRVAFVFLIGPFFPSSPCCAPASVAQASTRPDTRGPGRSASHLTDLDRLVRTMAEAYGEAPLAPLEPEQPRARTPPRDRQRRGRVPTRRPRTARRGNRSPRPRRRAADAAARPVPRRTARPSSTVHRPRGRTRRLRPPYDMPRPTRSGTRRWAGGEHLRAAPRWWALRAIR
jgi:hypothetical protein